MNVADPQGEADGADGLAECQGLFVVPCCAMGVLAGPSRSQAHKAMRL